MLNALMALQNQLLGEASRQWNGLAKEMNRARREYLRLAGTRLPDPVTENQQPGPLRSGQATSNQQDAWNSVNGGPV